jgi:hypothetical protein
MVSAMVVDAVSVPEVPVMVTLEVPAAAVLLAANVTMLVAVAGFVPNVAVTPVGKPDAARVTAPVNPPTSVTIMVSVALLPAVTDSAAAETESLGPPSAVTVSAIVVDVVSVPEVPVIVAAEVPAVAVLLAANVTTLAPVVGFVPNVAVTPLGNPDAASVTLPVNVPISVTAMVSVPLAPWAIDRVGVEGASVKLPVDVEPPQVVPFTANDAGAALATPFQVPLNPMPERLPPAGMLPLYDSLVTVTFAPL